MSDNDGPLYTLVEAPESGFSLILDKFSLTKDTLKFDCLLSSCEKINSINVEFNNDALGKAKPMKSREEIPAETSNSPEGIKARYRFSGKIKDIIKHNLLKIHVNTDEYKNQAFTYVVDEPIYNNKIPKPFQYKTFVESTNGKHYRKNGVKSQFPKSDEIHHAFKPGFAVDSELIELAKKITPLKPGQILSNIDEIRFTADKLIINGWALAQDGVKHIEVLLNEEPIGRAYYGKPRQDVAKLHPYIIKSRNSGFSFGCKFDNIYKCEEFYDIKLKIVSNYGSNSIIQKRLKCQTPDRPEIICDSAGLTFDSVGLSGRVRSENCPEILEIYIGTKLISKKRFQSRKKDGNKDNEYEFSFNEKTYDIYPKGSEHKIKIAVKDNQGNISELIIPVESTGIEIPILFCDNINLSKEKDKTDKPISEFNSELTISGQILADNPIENIEVYFDNQFAGYAEYGLPGNNLKVCFDGFLKCENSGFRVSTDISKLFNGYGYRDVSLTSNTEKGSFEIFRKPVLVKPNNILATVDDLKLFEDSLEVSGWALYEPGIDRIEIYLDDIFLGKANYGIKREDVQEEYNYMSNSLESGFSFKKQFFESPRFEITNNVDLNSIVVNAGSSNIIKLKISAKDGSSIFVNRTAQVESDDDYSRFLKQSKLTKSELNRMKTQIPKFEKKPGFSICVSVNEQNINRLTNTIHSLVSQIYDNFQIIIFYDNNLDPARLKNLFAENDAYFKDGRLAIYPDIYIKEVSINVITDFTGFVFSGDILQPETLYEAAKLINSEPETDIIYTDEDALINDRRRNPFFKPDWSPWLLLTMNYIGNFFICKNNIIINSIKEESIGKPELFDLLLKLTESAKNIRHIPKVLYSAGFNTKLSNLETKRIIEETLLRRGYSGNVRYLAETESFKIKWEIKGKPKVSIFIPTCFSNFEDNICKCLKSIFEKTSYSNYELIVIENSFDKTACSIIREMVPSHISLKIISLEEEFNFSRFNNLCAEQAEGKYFVLLNDDTEVVSGDWLESMVGYAQMPDVGLVGAKLLYPNFTMQHGGIFFTNSGGGCGHLFKNEHWQSKSHHGLINTVRECSAVTFGCVMIPKNVYHELKGLDETFRIECNDPDFALRAAAIGYKTLWTPFAVLVHKEYSSRKQSGDIAVESDSKIFWERWGDVLKKGDKFYNPNLSVDREDYSIKQVINPGRHH